MFAAMIELPYINPAAIIGVAVPMLVVMTAIGTRSHVPLILGGKLTSGVFAALLIFNVGGIREGVTNQIPGLSGVAIQDEQTSREQLKESVHQLQTKGTLNRSFAQAGRNIVDAGLELIRTGEIPQTDGPIQIPPMKHP